MTYPKYTVPTAVRIQSPQTMGQEPDLPSRSNSAVTPACSPMALARRFTWYVHRQIFSSTRKCPGMAVAMEAIDTDQKLGSNIAVGGQKGAPCTQSIPASALTCYSASGWTTYLLTATRATIHTSCAVEVTLAVAAIYSSRCLAVRRRSELALVTSYSAIVGHVALITCTDFPKSYWSADATSALSVRKTVCILFLPG